jgi:VIT1/CCC1 family predicted Fe2+/Mn2+ transporter
MQVLQDYLWQAYHFITGNYYALGAFAVVVIYLAIKKPKVLFQLAAAVVGVIALVYILVFLEGAMLEGHTDKRDVFQEADRAGER